MYLTQKTLAQFLGLCLFCLFLLLASQVAVSEGRGLRAGENEWVDITVRIMDAGPATEKPILAAAASANPQYLLLHQQGHVIAEAVPGQALLPFHRVWLKGEDQLFVILAAEEHRFAEVRLSGLLREHRPDVGILELTSINILQTSPCVSRALSH